MPTLSYRTPSVNGDGEFELVEYLPEGISVDDLAWELWKKKTRFPKIQKDLKAEGENAISK